MDLKKAVYIHIPFCKSICSYCDFCKVFYNKAWVKKYLDCLKMEIDDIYMNEEVDTLYIGGGTPSVLNKNELTYLFDIIKKLNIKKLKEFTFECNLNDITEDLLDILISNNVNRLSIGIESFNPEKLKYMGRNHTFSEALEKISLCRSKGINNINIDFIYGFNFETIKMLKKDLKLILKLNPEHISTYSLMIEDNTLLKINNFKKIDEDMDALMYQTICKILKKHKYNHYEVSNFAKKGFSSIHNLRYWQNKEYYGFGASASGYIDNIRYTNTLSLTKYLSGEYSGEKEILTKKDIMDNHLMLGFRLVEGINISEFENLYNTKLADNYPIKPLLKNKDLIMKKGNIFINPDKLYVMNEILIKMI
jgi:oxygen-independent coproporphyrinogen-3 oxidase